MGWNLKNSNCDKTQIVTKFKNSNCDKTKNSNCDKTKKKSYCEKTQKLKMRRKKDKTQIVTKIQWGKGQVVNKLKLWQKSNWEEKLKKFNVKRSNCNKTWELKLKKNSKNLIVTKLEIWPI